MMQTIKGQVSHDSSFMRHQITEFRDREENAGCQGFGWGEERELLFNEHRVPVWENESSGHGSQ